MARPSTTADGLAVSPPTHGSLPLLAWNGAEWQAWSDGGSEGALVSSVRCATWNTWFDREISAQGGGAEERWTALFGMLFDRKSAHLDVVMLQELTRASWAVLLGDERVRAEWLVTDLLETLCRTRSKYGVAVLCRRALASKVGARASSVKLPTHLERCLVTLELGSGVAPLVRLRFDAELTGLGPSGDGPCRIDA